jgi:hypothetical protein
VVEAVVENTGRRLLPGQYVQMRFVTGGRQDAVMVPPGAVARLGAKATVWVLKSEDQVQPVEVTTGLESPERVEILKGLEGGERVVARGHEALYAGARVSDVSAGTSSARAGGDPHAGMPEMGEAPARPSAPEKAQDMKDMPGPAAGTQMAQAGAARLPREAADRACQQPRNALFGKATLRFEVKDAAGAPVSDAKVEVNADARHDRAQGDGARRQDPVLRGQRESWAWLGHGQSR